MKVNPQLLGSPETHGISSAYEIAIEPDEARALQNADTSMHSIAGSTLGIKRTECRVHQAINDQPDPTLPTICGLHAHSTEDAAQIVEVLACDRFHCPSPRLVRDATESTAGRILTRLLDIQELGDG